MGNEQDQLAEDPYPSPSGTRSWPSSADHTQRRSTPCSRVKAVAATDPIIQELREPIRNRFPKENGNLSEAMRTN